MKTGTQSNFSEQGSNVTRFEVMGCLESSFDHLYTFLFQNDDRYTFTTSLATKVVRSGNQLSQAICNYYG